MRYSVKPKYRKYVKGYGFLSFARKFGNKHSKKLMESATETGIDAAKTTSKRVDKIADKITSVGKSKKYHKTKKVEEIYILPGRRQQIIDDLKLFWAENAMLLYENVIPKNYEFAWCNFWW